MISWQCRGFRQKCPDRTFRTSHPVRMAASHLRALCRPLEHPTQDPFKAVLRYPFSGRRIVPLLQLLQGRLRFRQACNCHLDRPRFGLRPPALSLCLAPLVLRQASRDPFLHPPLAAPTVRLAVRLIEPGASQTDRPDRRLPELRSHLSLTPHSHEFQNGLALRLPTPPAGASASLGISDVPGQGPHPPQPVILQSPSPAERRCRRASVGRPVRYGGPAPFRPSPSKASGILRSLERNAPGGADAGQEDAPSPASPSCPESESGSAPTSADEETGPDASGDTPATGPGLALDRMRIFRRGR